MKKIVSVFLYVLIFAVVFEVVYYFYDFYYRPVKISEVTEQAKIDSRRKVFAQESESQYPGSGSITINMEGQIFVVPQNRGQPFFDSIIHKDSYSGSDYKIYEIDGSKSTIVYFVGNFSRWENIKNSKDRLIVLTDPKEKSKLYKFRVAFEKSDLFGPNSTSLAIENLARMGDKSLQDKRDTLEYFHTEIMDMKPSFIHKIFQEGDIVIVTPVFETPNPNKTDENGNVLASWIIIRRQNGKGDLKEEAGDLPD